jgi:ABC-type amino acid transport system permease subunit
VQIFMIFYGLPQARHHARAVHRRVALRDDLGRRIQQRELPRRLRGGAVSATARRRSRSGFGPLRTFVHVTFPIGTRIALPASINTYISIVKNTSLMYVIGYSELTTIVAEHQQPDARDAGVAHRARRLVPRARCGRCRRSSAARVPPRPAGAELGDARLGEPVVRYILEEGLPNTLRVAAVSRSRAARSSASRSGPSSPFASCPLRALLRLYVEVFRGLPILVTVFHRLLRPTVGLVAAAVHRAERRRAIALVLWGSAQVAEATRGAVQSIPREQHEAGVRPRLRLGRPARVRDHSPQGGAPAPAAVREPACEHHPETRRSRR